MVIIPEGYEEIKEGDIILKTDLVCPKDKNKFLKLKPNNLAIGKPYRAAETLEYMFPETVIIRLIQIPKINVWCPNVNRYPGAQELIDSLVRNHVHFKKYKYSGAFYNNFYILTEYCGIGENYLGFTYDGKIGNFKGLKDVSYPELIKILGGTVPVQKPFKIIFDMNVRIKENY